MSAARRVLFLRNTLMMLGAFCVAFTALPMITSRVFGGGESFSGEAYVAIFGLSTFVVFAVCGAVLSAALESTRRVAWVVALGLLYSFVRLYWTTFMGSLSDQLVGIGLAVLAVEFVLPAIAAWLGCTVERLWHARNGSAP